MKIRMALKVHVGTFMPFSGNVSFYLLPITFFACIWLFNVDEDYWCNFVQSVTMPQFMCRIMANSFTPKDLLLLARVSKVDNA